MPDNDLQIENRIYRLRISRYRRFLFLLLGAGVLAVLLTGYFLIWNWVPSTIMMKAGVDQKLQLYVPVSGELYKEAVETGGTIGKQKKSEVQGRKSLQIDLTKTVTLKAKQVDSYRMDLKLFGVVPFKNVNVEVIPDVMLKPAGIPIGIYVETNGILVVGVGSYENETGQQCAPAKNILQVGDYILEMNDEKVESKAELIDRVAHCEGQPLVLKIRRGENELPVRIRPQADQGGEYKLGIWVRDNAQGVGTMTYVDEQGHFGALGHGINDVDTSTLMDLGEGKLYHTEIIGITRGSSGSPGELTGFIEYDDRNVMGRILENTVRGIFGECSPEIFMENPNEYMELCLKQDIKKGPAQIICSLGGELKQYDIEILDINLENDNVNRGIVLQVTDKELLSATGGIVQGMSGSPIIQDGKLVGAVTHVLVRDAAKGYGIFIEEMLEH